jgi:hypothetical protein
MEHQLLAVDEGRQRLSLVDTRDRGAGWTLSLDELPLARDLQRLGPDRALVGYDRGFFELEISTGAVGNVCDRWRDVTAVRRLPDGGTLVTGTNLDGDDGIVVLTLDRDLRETARIRRDGDYVRLMRPVPDGYLLCSNDHILETDLALAERRRLRAPGFEHAWMAQRQPDGTTLVSAGYGAFIARFDVRGALTGTFGRAGEVPEEVAPFFYATFQVLDDGRIVVANWQGHGPDNGGKGRQLLEFSPSGKLLDSWSDEEKISSLQGILVL